MELIYLALRHQGILDSKDYLETAERQNDTS